MRLQGAIFDMDGTLLDSMGMWGRLGDDFLRGRGIEPRENLWEDVRPRSIGDIADYYKRAYGFPETADALQTALEARIAGFYAHAVKAKPGVEKFLALLKLEGVWMYVATATDRPLAEAGLRCAGIDGYFRGMVTCAEAGAGKRDSAAVYEMALTRLRSTKKDTVVFEDALPAVRTAKAAGFRVAGVYEPAFEADQPEIRRLCDEYFRSFEELYEARPL